VRSPTTRPNTTRGNGHDDARAIPVERHRTARARLRLALLRSYGFARRLELSLQSGLHSRRCLSEPCSILVIRPDHLGDLLFLIPALRDLRERLPDARINLMVGPWGHELMQRNPYVDEVMSCAFPAFTRQPKRSALAPYRQLVQEANTLHGWLFDVALIMRHDDWWSAMLAHTAGIPWRIGYDIAETRPFLNHPVPYITGQHEVLQNLALARQLEAMLLEDVEQLANEPAPALELARTAEDTWAKRWLAARGRVSELPLVAIHPGAGAAVKQWTADQWAAVIDGLIAAEDGVAQAQVVMSGTRSELDLVWDVVARTQHDPMVAAGETSLWQLAALYRHCQLVIGPDCGPLHLAIAVGTPTVHLYGPVDAATFGPWGDPLCHRVVTSRWPCVPCNRLDFSSSELAAHHCVRAIDPQQVIQEARSLLVGNW